MVNLKVLTETKAIVLLGAKAIYYKGNLYVLFLATLQLSLNYTILKQQWWLGCLYRLRATR